MVGFMYNEHEMGGAWVSSNKGSKANQKALILMLLLVSLVAMGVVNIVHCPT